jgi:hypothetical protein
MRPGEPAGGADSHGGNRSPGGSVGQNEKIMKPGRSLEKLIAYLERHLAASDKVVVESPKRIRDKTTGRLREHDVVLTVTSGHHKIMVAVECRDRSRPVGVPQIEGFAKKCSETLVDKGVIVSPCGFTSTALLKSKVLGIRCLSLDEVETLPWLFKGFTFKQYNTSYKHFDFTVIPEEDFPDKPTTFDLVNEQGETVSIDDLRDIIGNAIREHQENQVPPEIGDKTENYRLVVPNLRIIDRESGIEKGVKHVHTVVHKNTTAVEIPFVMQEYKDPTSENAISQLAVATVDFGFAKGRLVINHKIETGGEVVFIPDADNPRNRIENDDN